MSGKFMNFSDAHIRGMHVLFTKLCAWFVDSSQLPLVIWSGSSAQALLHRG